MDNNKPIELSGIKNITISGRIAAGSTSLGNKLSEILKWKHIEGGDIFWETKKMKILMHP
jgi:cytidylate kinase